MKQEIRRARKASEVRPVLDEMAVAASNAQAGSTSYSARHAYHVEMDKQGRLMNSDKK